MARPSKITDEQWAGIRAEYETGATVMFLSRKHGIDPAQISRRKKAEAWDSDLAGAVNRRAEAKADGLVNGLVNNDDLKKADTVLADAIDAAADVKAGVIVAQRRRVDESLAEWEDKRKNGTFEDGKKVKIFAESLKLLHEEQRKAYGITDKDGQDGKDKVYVVKLPDMEQEF